MAYRIAGLESWDGGANSYEKRAAQFLGGVTATGARTGANGFNVNGSGNGSQWDPRPGVSVVRAQLGAWVYCQTAGDGDLFRFREGTIKHVVLARTGNDLYIHRAGTTLGTAIGAAPSPGTGAYLEVWVFVDDTTGYVKVYKNGVLIIDLTNQDTRAAGVPRIERVMVGDASGVDGAAIAYTYDDAYWGDHDAVGDAAALEMSVETQIVNANGNYAQWVGSDGNSVDNYLLADEANPDMTDYIGSGVVGNKDSHGLPDLVATAGTVRAVMSEHYALKSAAGPRSFRPFFRRAGVDGVGADKVLATAADIYDEVFLTDPTDASAWSIPKVNALEVGEEVRA